MMDLVESFSRPRVEVDHITAELKEIFQNHGFSGSEKIGLAISVIISESQKAFDAAKAAESQQLRFPPGGPAYRGDAEVRMHEKLIAQDETELQKRVASLNAGWAQLEELKSELEEILYKLDLAVAELLYSPQWGEIEQTIERIKCKLNS